MNNKKNFVFLISVLILSCNTFSYNFDGKANAITTQKNSDRENNKTFLITQEVYTGKASWYGPQFHGRLTANGETFDQNALTAAHKTLPFGTKVKVTNIDNGLSVVVRINDRGPFIKNRIIDLSYGAALKIGIIDRGVGNVRLEILGN